MALIEIPLFEDVQTFSLVQRRPDGPWGPLMACEANVHMVYTRDTFNRGLGDIWGRAYGETPWEALALAHDKMLASHAERLAEKNAIPPSSEPPRGLKQDNILSEEKLASIAGKLNITLDL